MPLKRTLAIVVGCILLSTAISAQDLMRGSLKVSSTPAGARVTVEGGVKVSGVTPTNFQHLLIGQYKLTVSKPGYEDYNTTVFLTPEKEQNINVSLTPKTRFKSFARSLFIPGWGQRYTDQKGKGFVFTALTIASVTAYFITDADFDDKYDIFNAKLKEYDKTTSSEQRRLLYDDLIKAQNDAYDAENYRRVAIGSAIGIWALNVVDALFFFPDKKDEFIVKDLSLTPKYDADVAGLQLTLKF